MRRHNQINRFAFILAALGLAAGLLPAGCNYPTGNAATWTADALPTRPPPETAALSETPQPSDTLPPGAALVATETPFPSDTPEPTAASLIEQVGVVILNGQEIGAIQKSGEKFEYTADPDKLTPEVSGKVVLQIKDPQQIWGFDLKGSSSTMYRIDDDSRSGWEAYGMLVAYRGIYEITVKFIALNAQTGEKSDGNVRIEIVGATLLATDTPELEIPEH